jgi:sugar phosphate isomerase/epimerase
MRASLSIAGLHDAETDGPWRAAPRAVIEWASGLDFRALHLDASAPGLRPRELDRSARRDLAATLRRSGLGFTGVDLWIPPAHYEDPARSDRALGALAGAIAFAGELGALLGVRGAGVCVTLPAEPDGSLRRMLSEQGDRAGVVIEDHGTGEPGGLSPPFAPGFDSARAVLRGEKPEEALARLASVLRSLRLNDADDTGRRPLGRGRVDLDAMLALHATLAPSLPIVTDLRGLHDPGLGAEAVRSVLGPRDA